MSEQLRDKNGLTEAEFLASYCQKDYPRPSLTADIVLFAGNKAGNDAVLLVKRGAHPYLGCWALPGGFVGQDEDADTAAARELAEEAGVSNVPLELSGFYSTPGRDPRAWTVSAAYTTRLEGELVVRAGDDAADACWFDIDAQVDDSVGLIKLAHGNDSASVCFELLGSNYSTARAQVTSAKGLAFDHARILVDAYLHVTGVKLRSL